MSEPKPATPAVPLASADGGSAPPAARLRDLSGQQWRSGAAAWLGWFFDGLDMHLYGLVAAPFVAYLLARQGLIPDVSDTAHELVRQKSGWIQAAFLIGWALGGGFFGCLGDRLGRSRALCLTILCYALFTGLSFFAQTWWQLFLFRFITALGIGGEWAVGSSLLAETWPRRWRPWVAAVLQTGVNLGVLMACLVTYLLADLHPRWVFLTGALPALVVFWIRRHVPEPEEWRSARQAASGRLPGLRALFAPGVRRLTLLIILVCGCSLSAWWSFMFWHSQHLRNLPDLNRQLQAEDAAAGPRSPAVAPEPAAAQGRERWVAARKQKLASTAFFLIIGISMFGNFAAGGLAQRLGDWRAIALMLLGFFLAMLLTFLQPRSYQALVWFWFPLIGFFSGVFGLFTMYLPPLFPTLLRTTGAGFCYNIGRLACAFGVVFSGSLSRGGDFSRTLLAASLLLLPATLVAWALPEGREEEG